MEHFNKDLLYKFELKLLDEIESRNISLHLKKCPKCTNELNEIKKTFKILKTYEPTFEVKSPLRSNRRKVNFIWIKRAAIILIAMFIGYGGSEYFKTRDTIVIGPTFIPQNNSLDTLTFINCENVDVYINNYP